MKNFVEDISIAGRKAEIGIKLGRLRAKLDEAKMEAALLTKHPNFSWITAGGKGFVANCFDNSATAVLVTKHSLYAVCNVIEEPRLIDEEKLPELGFELFVYKWQENKLREFVSSKVGALKNIISDGALGDASVDNNFLLECRLPLTENEIARYVRLGDMMSAALEDYIVTVKPGMTEFEIAGGISAALWKHNIEQVMHLISVDERADKYRHALPTEKVLAHNLLVSINGRYKGLVTTTRAWSGRPVIPRTASSSVCFCRSPRGG
jgi:Xaa-Pro aminopeptidase